MFKYFLMLLLAGNNGLLAQSASFLPAGWPVFPARDSVPALFEAQTNPAWLGQDRPCAGGLSYNKPFGLPGGGMMAGAQGYFQGWGWGGFFSMEQHPSARNAEWMVALAKRLASHVFIGGGLLFQQQRIVAVEQQRRVGARLGVLAQLSRPVSISAAWNQRWLLSQKANAVLPAREWMIGAGFQASSYLRVEGSLVDRGFGPGGGSLWLHVCPAQILTVSGGFELPSGAYVMQVLLARKSLLLTLRVRHQQPLGVSPGLRVMYHQPTLGL